MKDIFYNIKKFFKNLKIYWPILKSDEWWDYYYFENLIIHKLKNLEKHWGKDTHYVGDCFTKKRIQVLLRKWERIEKFEEEHPFDENVEKMKIQWYNDLGRLMPRLWD